MKRQLAASKPVSEIYAYSVSRDDRGRIVCEVWHKESGKTVGITECNTVANARHWAAKLISTLPPW